MNSAAAADCRLPIRQYPGISQFALDLVEGKGTAGRFVHAAQLASLTPRSRQVDSELVAVLRRANAGWGNDVGSALDRWSREATVTIVAGQQVGFAGGPLYTLVKLASMVALRRELAERGIASTLFFWMATEDHDFEEVATIVLTDGAGRTTELRSREQRGRRPVGPQPIPEDLRLSFLSATGSSFRWLEKGMTFRDSFGTLIAEVLRQSEIILVDALEPALRRFGAPILGAIGMDLPLVESLIDKASTELQRNGYSPQVTPAPDGHYSLLFRLAADGERQPIRSDDVDLGAGAKKVTSDGLEKVLAEEPQRISTGALARPLLQDFVFSPDLFVGGPAEVAYYAQLEEVYQHLKLSPPAVVVRGHALVAPARTLRAMERFGITPEELTLSPDAILARRQPRQVEQAEARVAEVKRHLLEELNGLRELVAGSDRSTTKSMARTASRIEYHFDRAAERARRSVVRADAERYEAVSRLCRTLFPDGIPQDRRVSWISWWLIYGPELFERLSGSVLPGAASFDVLAL